MFLYNMKDPTCSVMLFPPSKRCISLCGIGASCGAAVSAATADALSGQWLHPAHQAKRAALPMGTRKAGQTGGVRGNQAVKHAPVQTAGRHPVLHIESSFKNLGELSATIILR